MRRQKRLLLIWCIVLEKDLLSLKKLLGFFFFFYQGIFCVANGLQSSCHMKQSDHLLSK